MKCIPGSLLVATLPFGSVLVVFVEDTSGTEPTILFGN